MLNLWGVEVREKTTSPGPPAPAGHFPGPGVASEAFRTSTSEEAAPALLRTHDAARFAGLGGVDRGPAPLGPGVLRWRQATRKRGPWPRTRKTYPPQRGENRRRKARFRGLSPGLLRIGSCMRAGPRCNFSCYLTAVGSQ